MSTKDEILELVDELDEEGAEEVLGLMRWLVADEDELTPDEWAEVRLGKKQIARGESILLDDLLHELGE